MSNKGIFGSRTYFTISIIAETTSRVILSNIRLMDYTEVMGTQSLDKLQWSDFEISLSRFFAQAI